MVFLAAIIFLTPCNNDHHQLLLLHSISLPHGTDGTEVVNLPSYILYLIQVTMTILKPGK